MYKGNARLSQRIAEEAQLLTEEKWIIDALKKLKEHRNCLQIERLHLENLKSQLRSGSDKRSKASVTSTITPVDTSSEASQPSFSCSTSSTSMNITHPVQHHSGSRVPGSSMLEFDVPLAGIDDEMCNNEELNLAVTNSVFANQETGGFDMEEEEEDMENCVIDMNMFMYGK